MRFDFVIAVWGPWHLDAFNRAMAPSLLAPGNLPALAARHQCCVRIFTTETSAARLNELATFRRLHDVATVDMRVSGSGDHMSSNFHLAWWQQAIEQARAENAIIISAHPDVMWSSNSFTSIGREFEAGKKAVVVPNIRVAAETFLPAVEKLTSDCVLNISGADAAALAVRHLHPLSAGELAGCADTATATTMLSPAPGRGIVLRHASRPAIAANPRLCQLDLEFYVRDVTDPAEVYNLTDVSDMLMLSIAPIFKDTGLFTFGESMTPLHLARWCAHPQNDTPLSASYARDPLLLGIDPTADPQSLKADSAPGDDFMERTVRLIPATKVFNALTDLGCSRAAAILALALHETDPLSWPAASLPITILAPDDDAIASRDIADARLLAVGHEAELVASLASYVIPGQVDLTAPQQAATLADRTVPITFDGGSAQIDGLSVAAQTEPHPGIVVLKLSR